MTADATTTALLENLEDDLPAGSAAALEVLWLADDPDTGVADLGRAAMGDPGLTSRLMRVANSAYYGLSGKVSSATFAVTVLGFDTVRAIAATAAAGIDGARDLPEGFLADSATTAVSAALLAPRVGERGPEGHSLGLLHNIGVFLLHRRDPSGYPALVSRAQQEGLPRHQLERSTYGTSSGELGAALLETWRFPAAFTAAIASQQAPVEAPREPLGRVLRSAIALADLARGRVDHADRDRAALDLCFAAADADVLLERVGTDAARLEEALRS
jgi:HD-like signal output (HDOD) protein